MNLKKCLEKLEKENRLIRISVEVDPIHELAGVAAKLEGDKVVLFEKVKGYSQPVVCGLLWNRDHLASLFDRTGEELSFFFGDGVKNTDFEKFKPLVSAKPISQEVVEMTPNLLEIPTPTLALKDGGPYYSSSVVIAKDPDTGVRNVSVHRLMVTGERRMTMLMDVGRHLRDYYERAEKKGEPLEITINNGVDPAVYFAAITPSSAVGIDQDELAVAGFLRGEPVALSTSKTVAVEGIGEAQLIIEGEILPHIRETEGPFGEVTGYYALEDQRWVVEVKAITHQKEPVIQTLLPGMEVWNSVGLMAEASIFQTISKQIPGVKKVYLSHGGCGFYHAYVQMDPPRNGMGKNAILATFAAFPPLQMVTVVNSDVDIFNPIEVQQAMATRLRPDMDILVIPKSFGHGLNPATEGGYGGKVGFDCTYPLPKSSEYEKVTFQEVNLADYL